MENELPSTFVPAAQCFVGLFSQTTGVEKHSHSNTGGRDMRYAAEESSSQKKPVAYGGWPLEVEVFVLMARSPERTAQDIARPTVARCTRNHEFFND